MEALWKKRRPPTPLDWNNLPSKVDGVTPEDVIHDQRLWSIQECREVFTRSLQALRGQLIAQGDGGMLIWDKDDEAAMDFVTSAANFRAHIFGIASKTRFDIKSMAGNIIPAIATTNAIIAALIVMETLKVLAGAIDQCKSIYLNRQPNPRKKLLVPCALDKPNPKCYVCAFKPEVTIVLNTQKFTVKQLEEKVLKAGLGMVAPDVEIDDGKGTILISSEEGETEENNDKHLSEFGVQHNTILKCDDFLQNYNLNIIIVHKDKLEDDQEFAVVGDLSELQAKMDEDPSPAPADTAANGALESTATTTIDDDDLMLIEEEEEEIGSLKHENAMKRPREDDAEGTPAKKSKLGPVEVEIVLE